VNNEALNDLSWFRPLLEGNRDIEDEQVLHGVSRELEKFTW
jgi:hypothetical protein